MCERYHFSRSYVERTLTLEQVDLYVHLAHKAIVRDADVAAGKIGEVLIKLFGG